MEEPEGQAPVPGTEPPIAQISLIKGAAGPASVAEPPRQGNPPSVIVSSLPTPPTQRPYQPPITPHPPELTGNPFQTDGRHFEAQLPSQGEKIPSPARNVPQSPVRLSLSPEATQKPPRPRLSATLPSPDETIFDEPGFRLPQPQASQRPTRSEVTNKAFTAFHNFPQFPRSNDRSSRDSSQGLTFVPFDFLPTAHPKQRKVSSNENFYEEYPSGHSPTKRVFEPSMKIPDPDPDFSDLGDHGTNNNWYLDSFEETSEDVSTKKKLKDKKSGHPTSFFNFYLPTNHYFYPGN